MTCNYPKPPFYVFWIAFHIFVIGGDRDFKFVTTADKPPLYGAWLGSRDPFYIFGAVNVSLKRLKLVVKFCTQVEYARCYKL